MVTTWFFFICAEAALAKFRLETENDKFLRTAFAVDDMEAIREDFLDKNFDTKNTKWEAIVGWSFGSVLAQRYASHRTYGQLVKRLILISPLSRHMFKNSKGAYDDYYKSTLEIYRRTLDQIYSSRREQLHNEFGDLKRKDYILDQLFKFDTGILRKTEQAFGSVQTVIEAYSDIGEETFRKYKLRKFSQQFYQCLRELRITGANAVDDSGIIEKQRLIGKTLRDELLEKKTILLEEPAKQDYVQGSERAYYSFGIQDGLNWVFLRERFDRNRPVQDSVNAIRGEVAFKTGIRSMNPSVDKVKIDTTLDIDPWDPAKHSHEIPTLIINGEDDPVTGGGQAKHYFETGSTGPRTWINFPGVGHAISLGSIFTSFKDEPPILSGAIRVSIPEIDRKEIFATNGIATGVELNDNLHIDLEVPAELKNQIAIHACGIVRDDNAQTYKGSILNVIALIENLTERKIEIAHYKWRLLMPLVWGTIMFWRPAVIPPKTKAAIFGCLIDGQKNPEKEYHITPMFKDKIEPRLNFVGFNFKDVSTVELWFQNAGKGPLDPVVGQWVMENADSRFPFRVNVPRLKKQEIKSVPIVLDKLELDPSEVLTINPPKGLVGKISACFDSRAKDPHRLSFVVWNSDKTKAHRVGKGWIISSPVFSATVTLDSVKVEPNSIKIVAGDVTGIKWVSCLDIKPPFDWNRELKLLSFNILSRNSVSMLFENLGDRPTVSGCRDWKYVIPTVDPNETDLDRALNCLIFSFLVLDPSQFHIFEDNEALKRIDARFNGLKENIQHHPGNIDKPLGVNALRNLA